MKEDFLQAVWQMQYFVLPAKSCCGMEIKVIRPGIHNKESGPDFLQARLAMDGLEWNGSVEVHVRASEWRQHGHHLNPSYDSVVLHVVWEEDQPVFRSDGSRIPTLELRERIPLEIILNYRQLISREEKLSCSAMLENIPGVIKTSVLDSALAERLSRRAADLLTRHENLGFDWPRTAAHWLARCLGMRGNEDQMEWLIQRIPPTMLRGKMASESLEIILPWLAGFSEIPDLRTLVKMYPQIATLPETEPMKIQWQTGGRRPVSFPRERVKLLAELLPLIPHWLEIAHQANFLSFLSERGITLSWQMQNHLQTNFDAPFQAARILKSGSTETLQPVIDALHDLQGEPNAITRKMQKAGFKLETAAQTQGAKELHDYWCSKKKCMQCRIGIAAIGKPI